MLSACAFDLRAECGSRPGSRTGTYVYRKDRICIVEFPSCGITIPRHTLTGRLASSL